MAGWQRHEGLAVALPIENIDTDQLVPARFMSTPRAEGYGRFLLHDLRHDADGRQIDDFPLDRSEAKGASVLIARRNFGGGSSREAAVYALVDAGFRVVVAPSFGDIFSGNAVNNGLLPLRMDPQQVEDLIALAPLLLGVDLNAGTIAGEGFFAGFDLADAARTKLVNGWDDIDLTAARRDEIERFASERKRGMPWLWPVATT